MRKFMYKIITAGEGGVGKTTLLRRYLEGKFYDDTKLTIGVEFFAKELDLDENHFTLQLWDFGGQDRFRFMLDSYAMGAKGAFLLFDLTRMFTLNKIEEWINILRKHDPELPILFIGTKADLEDRISVDDDYVQQFVDEHKFFDYVKISSKTGVNVEESFQKLVTEIMNRKKPQ